MVPSLALSRRNPVRALLQVMFALDKLRTRPPTSPTMKSLMTSNESQGKHDGGFVDRLRAAALIAVVVGAVGSIGLVLLVGHRNPSRLLQILFVIWVLSPFVALALADRLSKRWSVPTQATLYSMMLVLTLATLAIYGWIAFGPPRAQPAFCFLMVPPASCLLLAIVITIATLISRRRSRRGDGV